jgi:hypothetical protein
MNKFIIYSFLHIMNGFCKYTNLLQILHLFMYCIEPHNRVKFDPGDKNDRKNHYIAPWLQNTPSEKLCFSLSSNNCEHFYLFFKSFL